MIDYNNGYLLNCYVYSRPINNGYFTLFESEQNGKVKCFLNGYAVIPIEEYFTLVGETQNSIDTWMKKIIDTDLELERSFKGNP